MTTPPKRWAKFDENGVCFGIVSGGRLASPPEGSYEVPEGLRPGDIWLDGDTVRQSEPFTGNIPRTLPVSDTPFSLTLPVGTMASVNGSPYLGVITIPCDLAGSFTIDIAGSFKGIYRLEVQSYYQTRKDAYPPIEEQLDALWKGGSEADEMRSLIADVKNRHPKPNEPTTSAPTKGAGGKA
jgi:hypothetical protein